jgi:hypothetical protein
MKHAFAVLALLCALAPAQAADRPLRDPFARPAPPPSAMSANSAAADAPAAPPAPLHLRAVILNGARSLADIDGHILGAGERAADLEVVRIDARGVLVSRGGKRELLLLNEKDKQ